MVVLLSERKSVSMPLDLLVIVLDKVSYPIGDGTLVDVCQDAQISNLSLSCWPIFINMDMNNHHRVSDLITTYGRGWRNLEVTHFLGGQLTCKILTIPIPTHPRHDLRVQRHFCYPKVSTRDFIHKQACADQEDQGYLDLESGYPSQGQTLPLEGYME